MGSFFSLFSRGDGPPVEEVKSYCKSIVFVKFYGQTNSKKGEADKCDEDGFGSHQTELGDLLKQLDAEVRKAPSPAQFEITDTIREILRKISHLRCDQKEHESNDQCYERLLKDAENFVRRYRLRNKISEALEHDHYWGTRQQLLFGKVVADWLDRQDKRSIDETPTDPIFGTLFNPTGGRVGPGDTGWFHNTLFDDYGHFAYHSAVHDGFGYLKTNHSTGPGYNYLDKGLFGDLSPLGGQISGISFWTNVLEECHPEKNLDNFYNN